MSYPIHNGSDYTAQPGNGHQEMVQEIPISAVLGRILRNWYWFALSTIITLAGAYFFLKTQTNQYQTSASLFISSEKEGARNTDFMKEIEYFNQTSGLEDEIGLLTSYSMIASTLDHLQYGISYYVPDGWKQVELPKEEVPFFVQIDSTHLQSANVWFQLDWRENGQILLTVEKSNALLYDPDQRVEMGIVEDFSWSQWIQFGDTVETQYFRMSLSPNEAFTGKPEAQYLFMLHTEYDLVQAYRAHLTVNPASEEGKIVSMVLEGPVIRKDVAFLDQLIQNYLMQELQQKQNQGRNTVDFISAQMDSISDSLRQVENQLAYFRESNEVVDPVEAAKGLQKQIESVEDKLLDVELKLGYFRFLSNNLKNGDAATIPAPSTEDSTDPLLRSLLEDLSNMISEKADLSFKTTKANPQYLLLEEQIAETRTAIESNVDNHVSTLEVRQKELQTNAIRLRAKLNRLPAYEKGLNKIERDYSSINDMYQYLQEKRAEADIALANQTVQHKLIDPPHLVSKQPVKPNKLLIMGLAMVLGLGLPFLIIMGKDLFNTKVTTQKDIQMSTPLPIRGYIVKNDTKTNVIHQENLQTHFAESFRALRVRLRYLNRDTPQQTIGITSSLSGEGKSFCSANLACVMGLVGEKTLLVDLDFRKPTQQSNFNLKGEKGLVNYLQGTCSLDEVIYDTHIPSLKLLPVGKAFYNPLDLLDQDNFHQLMEQFKSEYDRIIVDTPPLGRTSDYLMFRQWVDHTLYVVRHKYTRTHAFQEINDLYAQGQIDNISIVINAVSNLNYFQYGEAGLYGKTGDYYGKMYAKK